MRAILVNSEENAPEVLETEGYQRIKVGASKAFLCGEKDSIKDKSADKPIDAP